MNRVAQSADALRRSQALLTIWLTRHLPNLELVSPSLSSLMRERIGGAISPEEREVNAARMLSYLPEDCLAASTEACQTVAEQAGAVDSESDRIQEQLNHSILEVYTYLLERYRQNFIFSPVLNTCECIDSSATRRLLTARVLPAFQQLVSELEPYLGQLRQSFDDPGIRPVLMKQLQLLTDRMLGHLGFYQRLWLSPYLNLIEDLLCVPWRRLCEAAVFNSATPGAIAIVYGRLPKANAIAASVYRSVIEADPDLSNQLSRSGQEQVMQTLKTAQAHLWLHMLERHPAAVETGLVPACLALYNSTPMSWSTIQKSMAALTEAMGQTLTPKQQAFFFKYAQAAQELITKANPQRMNADQLKSWVDDLWSQQSDISTSDAAEAVATAEIEPDAHETLQLAALVDDFWQSNSTQQPTQPAAAPQEEPFLQYARSMQRLTRQSKSAVGDQEQLRHLMKEAWLVYISA